MNVSSIQRRSTAVTGLLNAGAVTVGCEPVSAETMLFRVALVCCTVEFAAIEDARADALSRAEYTAKSTLWLALSSVSPIARAGGMSPNF